MDFLLAVAFVAVIVLLFAIKLMWGKEEAPEDLLEKMKKEQSRRDLF
jgi:hypothetical protein